MALLVAIEGIDGSGKGTQAGQLVERLTAAGLRTALLSFPRYEATLFGQAIGEFLNGEFGRLSDVNPFLVSLLYAGDRFESRAVLQTALSEHDVVVLDRYVASNLAHQGCKVHDVERAKLFDRIRRIEYELYDLPRADLTVLLDLPADWAQRLVARKAARTYTDLKADLQEADGLYLDRVRQVYRHLAREERGWRTIDCLQNGELRNVDDIALEIEGIVKKTLTLRSLAAD